MVVAYYVRCQGQGDQEFEDVLVPEGTLEAALKLWKALPNSLYIWGRPDG